METKAPEEISPAGSASRQGRPGGPARHQLTYHSPEDKASAAGGGGRRHGSWGSPGRGGLGVVVPVGGGGEWRRRRRWRGRTGLGLKTVGIYPVPFRSDFYILPARFRIFEQIRNQYEIRDVKFENGSKTVCHVSRSFPYFPYLIGISRFHKFELSRFLQPKSTSLTAQPKSHHAPEGPSN